VRIKVIVDEAMVTVAKFKVNEVSKFIIEVNLIIKENF